MDKTSKSKIAATIGAVLIFGTVILTTIFAFAPTPKDAKDANTVDEKPGRYYKATICIADGCREYDVKSYSLHDGGMYDMYLLDGRLVETFGGQCVFEEVRK